MSEPRPHLPWVWFDLDDTLWDFRANSHETLAQVYAVADLKRFWADVDTWRDIYHKVNDELWALYAPGMIDRDTLRVERFARPLRSAGCPEPEATRLARELDPLYLTLLGKHTRNVEGAHELLERLAPHFNIGILSNGFAGVQQAKLRSGDLERFVNCIVLSDEIDVNKPDKRIYDYALQKAGITVGHSTLVGDNVATDIAGALNAGWRAVWYNPARLPVPPDMASNPRLNVVSTLDYPLIKPLLVT